MARIPKFQSSRRFTPATTGARFDPGLASQSGRALQQVEAQRRAEDRRLGNAISQAAGSLISSFGAEMGKAEAKQRDLMSKRYLIDNTIGIQKEAFEHFNSAVQEHPDGIGLVENVTNFFNTRGQEIISQAPDERTALVMSEKLGNLGLQYFKRSFNTSQELTQKGILNSINTGIAETVNRGLFNPNGYETNLQQIKEFSKNLVTNGVPAVEAAQIARKGMGELAKASVRGRILAEPEIALSELLSGKYNNALNHNEIFGLIQNSQSEVKKQQRLDLKQLDDQILTTLGDSIEAGQITFDPANKTHRTALDQKFITELSIASGATPEEVARNTAVKNSADIISGLLPQLEDPETIYNTSIGFITKHKGVPSALQSVISSNVNNGSPERQALFSRLLNDLYKQPETRAAIVSSFKTDTIENALEMNENLLAGYDAEKASEITQSIRLPINDQTTEARKEMIQGSDELKLDNVIDQVSDLLDVDSESHNIVLAAKEYQKSLKDHFIRTGSLERSQAAAARQVQDKFQKTNLNGEIEIHSRVPQEFSDNRFRAHFSKFIVDQNIAKGMSETEDDANLSQFVIPAIPSAAPTFEEFFTSGLDLNTADLTGKTPKMLYEGKLVNPRIGIDERTSRDRSVGMYFYNEFGFREPILNSDGSEMRFIYNPGKSSKEISVEKNIANLRRQREEENSRIRAKNTAHLDRSINVVQPNMATDEGRSVITQLMDLFLGGFDE